MSVVSTRLDRRRRHPRRPPAVRWRGVARQFDYHWTVYLRTWKASVVTVFASPAALRAGDGRAARRFRPRGPEPARRRLVVPRLHRARPDRGPGDADRDVRDDLPGDGRPEVAEDLLRPARQPAGGARPGQRHAGLHPVPGRLDLRRLLRGDGARSASSRRWWGPLLAWLVTMLDRDGLRGLDLRVQRPRPQRARLVRPDLPAGPDPAVPLLRLVLPDQQPRPGAGVGRPAHPAMARRQPHPHALPRPRRPVDRRDQPRGPGRGPGQSAGGWRSAHSSGGWPRDGAPPTPPAIPTSSPLRPLEGTACWCCATTPPTAPVEAVRDRVPGAGVLPVLDRHRRRQADPLLPAQRPRHPLRRVRRARACSRPRRSTAR